MMPPVLPVTVTDQIKFDLWCEPEWKEYIGKNHYVYESELVHCFLNCVRPGDICIDAGANVGFHSILLSRLVGELGQVLAFEPDPRHYEKLQSNIRLNGIGNIVPIQHALWKEPGNFEFWSVKGGGYSSFARAINMKPEAVTVQAFRLDDITVPDLHVRLMKIDCEGAEEAILQGAEKMLARTDFVICEFNYECMPIFGWTDRSMRDWMDAHGFDFFYLHQDGSAPTCVPLELKIEIKGDTLHMFNGLFARRQ